MKFAVEFEWVCVQYETRYKREGFILSIQFNARRIELRRHIVTSVWIGAKRVICF